MGIALITNFAPRGGAHVLFRRQALLLSNAGHDVFLFSDNMRLENGPHMQSHTISPIHERMKTADEQKIIDVLKYINPDIIHFHLTTLLRDTSIIFEVMKIAPVIITPHSHQFSCPSVKKILYRPLMPCEVEWSIHCLIRPYTRLCNHRHLRKLLNSVKKFCANRSILDNATFVIVTCNYMYGLINEGGVAGKKIKVLPPIATAEDAKPFCQKSDPILLFAGHLHQEKGVQCLLEASRQIRIPHKVWIAGDGWMIDRLKELAKDISDGMIEFLGWVAQKRLLDLYRKAAVLVMPSLCPETFGLSGLEALGCGTPVVAFDVGGISDWLIDGQNGFLVPVGNVKELAYRIEQLLRNPELANEMGRNGSALVRERFSSENHLRGLLSIYEEAVASFNR